MIVEEMSVNFRIPLWLRITIAVTLAVALVAVLFTGMIMILRMSANPA